ncbi:DUF1048 domain-containing protein [Clostridium frigoris]|uniref:DUF1048 domain-containing protein n=1 Tax=Clostridium frigoris TaxID=205327 RepID=A0ABS6BV23_9CLOT|nr:DUF1048 domain-containing protein [Clostridium frigoris]MBU3160774.1 DUF1048 domain-containing protein [Clostridium frigoris]
MLLECRLKVTRFKQQKKLNTSNLYLYKSITSYIQNSELRGTEKEEILQQVMDMMLQAQIEDKPMTLIIGNDYEEFCNSIIDEYSSDKSENYRVINYIQKSLLFTIILLFLFSMIRKITHPSIDLGITVDFLITSIAISFIMLPAIKKRNQERSSSQVFWYQELYAMGSDLSKSDVFSFFIAICTVGAIRLILLKILGTKIFTYTITLYSCIQDVGLILVIIIILECYKRMYNKGR